MIFVYWVIYLFIPKSKEVSIPIKWVNSHNLEAKGGTKKKKKNREKKYKFNIMKHKRRNTIKYKTQWYIIIL